MSLDQDKNRHYSLRKLSVGLVSVLIGISFISAKGQVVKADNVKDNAKSAINEQALKPEKQDMQASILKGTSNSVKQNVKNVDTAGIQEKTPPVQTSIKEANRSENSNSSLNSNDVSSLNKNTQTAQNDVPRENRAEVTQPQGKQQTSSDQNFAAKSQKNLLDNLGKQKTSAQSGDRVEDNVQTQLQNSQKLDLTKNKQLAKKVLATSLIETNSLATTNGGFDEATWGKLDVNDWQGSVQDGVYELTNYTGDSNHIIIPNEADFEQAGKSINGLQVGITRDTAQSLSLQGQTIAFSKTNNQKVKAIGTDWSQAFSSYYGRLSKFDGSNLDVSSVTNMSRMFNSNKISDLTSLVNWDTSNVTDMSFMFNDNSINDLTPLTNWNTSNVTDMSWMFDTNKVSDLTPLVHWDTSKVTDMSDMFEQNSISDLTPLAHWDTSKVTNMSDMFEQNSISDLTPLAHWNTSKVTNMFGIFDRNKVNDLTPLAHWDTSNVANMNYMFSSNLINDLTPLANWNTSKVTNMSSMFGYNSISDLNPLANWNTSKVTNMSSMFENNKINDLTPLTNWNTSSVTDMATIFAENPDIIDLIPIANWNISGLSLFAYDPKLDFTNINDTPLMQYFLKEHDALYGATFITNSADLVKATTGKDVPTLTKTAKRTIVLNIPNATPETIVQIINYKAIAPVQVNYGSREIVKTFAIKESDWQFDTSNSNVTVNDQPSTEYKAYTLDPNGKDVDFAAIPIPKIPGYKAKISLIPSGNSAQPAMFLVSFVALPSVNLGLQYAPDDTKQDHDAVINTKHLNTANIQIVSNQPVLLENADNSLQMLNTANNLQMLNADTDTSTWQIENNVADELITPYVVFNSNHKLHLPRFNNYNLQIIKHTSNKDNLSFVYLNQNKAFKYVFNIKIEDGEYLLSISQSENKRLIPVQQISFNDYYQLIKLIVKLISY